MDSAVKGAEGKKEEDKEVLNFKDEMALVVEKQMRLIPQLQRHFRPDSQEIRFCLNHLLINGNLEQLRGLGCEEMDPLHKDLLKTWWTNSWLARGPTYAQEYFRNSRKSVIINHDYGEVVDAVKNGFEVDGTRREWWITNRSFRQAVIYKKCVRVGEKNSVSPVIKFKDAGIGAGSKGAVVAMDGCGNEFELKVEVVEKHVTVAINNWKTYYPSHFEGICDCDHRKIKDVEYCFMSLSPEKKFPKKQEDTGDADKKHQENKKTGKYPVVRIPIPCGGKKVPVP